jgi:hypothetical protein
VEIKLKNGSLAFGVFESAQIESGNLLIFNYTENGQQKLGEPSRVLGVSEIISMQIKGLRSNESTKRGLQPVGKFQTDTEIGRKPRNQLQGNQSQAQKPKEPQNNEQPSKKTSKREMVMWVPDSDLAMGMDSMRMGSNFQEDDEGKPFDVFAHNFKHNGMMFDEFDPHEYTSKLDLNSFSKEELAEAIKKGNKFLEKERKWKTDALDNEDEEAMFSNVIREEPADLAQTKKKTPKNEAQHQGEKIAQDSFQGASLQRLIDSTFNEPKKEKNCELQYVIPNRQAAGTQKKREEKKKEDLGLQADITSFLADVLLTGPKKKEYRFKPNLPRNINNLQKGLTNIIAENWKNDVMGKSEVGVGKAPESTSAVKPPEQKQNTSPSGKTPPNLQLSTNVGAKSKEIFLNFYKGKQKGLQKIMPKE